MTRRSVVSRFAWVALLLATQGVAESTLDPAAQASPVTRETPDTEPVQTAKSILANQPAKLVDRLMKKKLIVMQEVREEGSLRGGLVSSYVIFDMPIERVYKLLSQSARQVEFRPELTSIETIEYLPRGPVDEQRLKILFRRGKVLESGRVPSGCSDTNAPFSTIWSARRSCSLG